MSIQNRKEFGIIPLQTDSSSVKPKIPHPGIGPDTSARQADVIASSPMRAKKDRCSISKSVDFEVHEAGPKPNR